MPSQPNPGPQTTRANVLTAVACPFCGLLCDDLAVATEADTAVSANGCARSRSLFTAHVGHDASPSADGTSVSIERAVERAAAILSSASQPLFLSAGTDVAGVRALLQLAERTGGVLDHINSDAVLRNLLVLQDTGWVGTTLTEVRNRCDLLVVASSGIDRRFPRFFERCLDNREALFDLGEREILFLGSMPAGFESRHRVSALDVMPECLGQVFAALRCLLAGRKLHATQIAGIPLEQLSGVLERMRAARYGVLTWAAADLDFPHAELTIQSACELVQELNRTSRFAVLPLGGTDGDLTVTQTATWQSGYPLRIGFGSGAPEFDPYRHSAHRLLEQGEADALVFVSALDPRHRPPATRLPTIVLGRPGTEARDAVVHIPVATPGLHHSGHLFRTDNVVAVPLRTLSPSPWPSASAALTRILEKLVGRA